MACVRTFGLQPRLATGTSVSDFVSFYPAGDAGLKAGAVPSVRRTFLANQGYATDDASTAEIATGVTALTDWIYSILTSLHRYEAVQISG